jgi:hypothetical protein
MLHVYSQLADAVVTDMFLNWPPPNAIALVMHMLTKVGTELMSYSHDSFFLGLQKLFSLLLVPCSMSAHVL